MRWFKVQDGMLSYYKTKEDEKAIKDLFLRGATSRVCTTRQTTAKQFPFELKTSKRTYIMYASSADERADWIACINLAAAKYK